MRVELPLDHLRELWPQQFRDARIAALLHPASVSVKLEHASHILERHSGDLFQIAAFFGPQHGFLGQTQDNMVEWKTYEHSRLHVPVYSLYGEHREPTPEMLKDVDVLLIDLQDIGTRYYTFIWTLYLCMRACEKHDVNVLVLDRPNPINGVSIEGPVLDPNYKSFVGMHPIPVRHGRTVGELAQQFHDEAFPKMSIVDLAVGWMGPRDVVRSNGTALGNAVAEYAHARHSHGLPWHVLTRRHRYFRRPGDDAPIRNVRRAVHRRGKSLSRTQ